MENRVSLVNLGSEYLAAGAINNSLRESEIFLSHILNCPRVELYLDNFEVQQDEALDYWQLLNERVKGLPLQYLLGISEFMGLKFKLKPGVFIPRPETEILVETVLNLLPATCHLPLKILDLGIGCGNIAISIARHLEKAHIFACDISDSALQLAQENSRLNEVRIYLVKSDLFGAFKNKACFSLIVSNPPYVDTDQIPQLSRELHYEPKEALDGGRDGLFYYRKIIAEAANYLQSGGALALEIGDNQGQRIREIFSQSGRFALTGVIKDYHAIERVMVAEKIR
ncbi:MAG: peptide chain release factor N(5)-glutamine methyltransferase [Omnitrophica bacterium]|nr:peptide chain release factor N(5)-glutamine methyltransferase [Candidatus Omnitrophota bacterium]